MTMTPRELHFAGLADQLLEVSGLDPMGDPNRYNRMHALAEELLRAEYERGRDDDRNDRGD